MIARTLFALRLDGDLISTQGIYLGAEGAHPPTNPFTIRRQAPGLAPARSPWGGEG